MANGIFSALGAALQAGGRTLGHLNQEEADQKARAEAQRLEQERWQAQFGLQQDQFKASQEDRRVQNLRNAIADSRQEIQDAPLGAQFSPEQYKGYHEQGLGHLFKDPQMKVNMPSTAGLDGLTQAEDGSFSGLQTTTPQMTTSIQRHATMPEQATQSSMEAQEKARASQDAYRAALQANPKMSAQERFTLAQQHGQQFTGMSPEEEQRQWTQRQAQQDAAALARAAVNNPPKPLGSPQERQWDLNYDRTYRNVRQAYAGLITEAAEAGDQAKVMEIEGSIDALVRQRIGERPSAAGAGSPPPGGGEGGGATQELIGSIDAALQGFGGDVKKMEQSILADQAELRAAGVDVQAYIQAIRQKAGAQAPPAPSAPGVIPEAKPQVQGGPDIMGWIKSQFSDANRVMPGQQAPPAIPQRQQSFETQEQRLRRLAGGQ